MLRTPTTNAANCDTKQHTAASVAANKSNKSMLFGIPRNSPQPVVANSIDNVLSHFNDSPFSDITLNNCSDLSLCQPPPYISNQHNNHNHNHNHNHNNSSGSNHDGSYSLTHHACLIEQSKQVTLCSIRNI